MADPIEWILTLAPDSKEVDAVMEDISKELQEQEDYIQKMWTYLNPDVLKKRLEIEKEIARVQKEAKNWGTQLPPAPGQPVPAGGPGGPPKEPKPPEMKSFDLLGGVANAMKEFSSTLGPVGVGIATLGGAMTALGMASNAALGPIGDILTLLVSAAGKASPSQFQMFSIAVEDIMGVIGQTFLPVLELMRDGVRLFGDVLATVLPNTQEATAALQPLFEAFQEIGKVVREVMGELGPIIRDVLLDQMTLLAELFREFAEAIMPVVQALGELVSSFMEVYKELKPLFDLLIYGPLKGMAYILKELADVAVFTIRQIDAAIRWLFGLGEHTKKEGLRSSVGAAARPAHFASVEEYQKQLQLAAFSQPGQRSAADMPMMVSGLQQTLDQLYNEVFKGFWDKMPERIADGIRRVGGRVVSKAGEAVQEGISGGIRAGSMGVISPETAERAGQTTRKIGRFLANPIG